MQWISDVVDIIPAVVESILQTLEREVNGWRVDNEEKMQQNDKERVRKYIKKCQYTNKNCHQNKNKLKEKETKSRKEIRMVEKSI